MNEVQQAEARVETSLSSFEHAMDELAVAVDETKGRLQPVIFMAAGVIGFLIGRSLRRV